MLSMSYIRRGRRCQEVFLSKKCCHPKMIMSYLAKIGMSYFDIECPFMKGGHYVRRGHCHVEYEGVKKASCYRSGNGDEGHASRGREGIRVNGSTDPQDY